jgi:hypothetical protein
MNSAVFVATKVDMEKLDAISSIKSPNWLQQDVQSEGNSAIR